MAEPAATAGATRFKAAHATGSDWGLIAKQCLDGLKPLPEGANLGFLYATDALADDLGSILTFLRERSGVRDWVGTVGLGIAASGVEVYDRPALALMTAALPPDSYRILAPLADGAKAWETADVSWFAERAPLLGVVHGDPRNPALSQIVARLSAATSAYLVGGLSAGHGGGFPQIAGRLTDGGLSGVLLGAELPVVAGLTQGCSPIGPVREITGAERNVVMEIDGRPALEAFKEDIGELLAQDLKRVAGYIYVAFPVTGSDTGDYLVRNLMQIDPERGWLAVGELVSEGERILFCRRDHDSALKDLERMLADVTRRAGPAPKAALYYSCVARGRNLFGSGSEELKLVRAALGDLPLVGFFANGEICNDRLYGYTGVLTLFL